MPRRFAGGVGYRVGPYGFKQYEAQYLPPLSPGKQVRIVEGRGVEQSLCGRGKVVRTEGDHVIVRVHHLGPEVRALATDLVVERR